MNEDYTVTLEDIETTYTELEPLYCQHYNEMQERLRQEGLETSPYNPRKEIYFKAGAEGWLLTFVLRYQGCAVGYCNIYLTNDMHNQDFIAREDTIYVTPAHRKGAGRLLSQKVHAELKSRGVKHMDVTTATDLRVSAWLKRQGYQHIADVLRITF